MANKKISELPAAGAITGPELVEIVKGGVNSQTTAQTIANLAAGGVTSVNGETGAVTGFAKLASPTFTGTPVAPTAAPGTDTTQVATTEFVHDEVVGVQDLYYPAFAGYPRATLGAFFANLEMSTSLVNLPVLAFQDGADKNFAQFQIVPPRKWNNGTITIVPHWTAQSGSGTVRWELNGGMYRNDDPLTTALGTAQTSDDTLLATNDFHSSPETAAITLSGTAQDSNFVVIQIARDPTNDTLNANACLIGITVRWTMDAAKDA